MFQSPLLRIIGICLSIFGSFMLIFAIFSAQAGQNVTVWPRIGYSFFSLLIILGQWLRVFEDNMDLLAKRAFIYGMLTFFWTLVIFGNSTETSASLIQKINIFLIYSFGIATLIYYLKFRKLVSKIGRKAVRTALVMAFIGMFLVVWWWVEGF